MENQQKINLYQVRDFGENFSVLLDFLRQNYSPILKGIVFVFPVMLLATYLLLDLQTASMGGITNPNDIFDIYASPKFWLGLLLSAIASLSVNYYTVAYMVKYTETESITVENSDVWNTVKKIFLPLFFASIVYGLAIGVGFVLCFIPGVILLVYLMFYQFCYTAEEDTSILDSFSRSWNLVKDNWFSCFGFMFVIGILAFILALVFSLPQYIPIIGTAFDIPFLSSEIVLYITTFIYYAGSLMLAPLTTVAIGVLYFSRRSDYDNIEINDNIDQIGMPRNNNDQYY